MATVYHNRTIAVSISQVSISRNTKCAIKDSFCRDGHINSDVMMQTFDNIHLTLQSILFIVDIKFNHTLFLPLECIKDIKRFPPHAAKQSKVTLHEGIVVLCKNCHSLKVDHILYAWNSSQTLDIQTKILFVQTILILVKPNFRTNFWFFKHHSLFFKLVIVYII